ncbi:MAG TPA: 16S rRNA (adenine(1518)-N(6)/adenine(1519)-N(6))-dimethyltransferase RsmA [Gammaproteobacteria bacterium]|jgi:16S rRNA (adenine1518-N6/adenine1519-N6)-dimethyltransferase|nr:16S rRNA (adenine(1518)-N(6)/adenine(1519)-N(6))-dimethyltransferase RsmA [Gammaproteobacteria bacterium]
MHIPRKRFGQHFLCDQSIVQRIVSAIKPTPSDFLVEIGPGQGAITLPVLKIARRLDVIEFDRDLIPELDARTEGRGDLVIHEADALTFDFSQLHRAGRMLRVFGNLPYNISTPLLFHLLEYAPIISDMVFMLQKEVAERLAAPADTDNYGRLSVMVQYHCKVDLLFDVPPSAFFPPPKVQSSIVRLIPYRELPHTAIDYNLFSSIVRHAFGQRRKTLRNSLRELIDAETWERMPVRADLRAEDLTVQDFVAISNVLSQS